MKSKHLDGLAVDVMAYVGSRGSWEMSLYDNIADAFKLAAIEEDVAIRWGASMANLRHAWWMELCKMLWMNILKKKKRRSQGRRSLYRRSSLRTYVKKKGAIAPFFDYHLRHDQ